MVDLWIDDLPEGGATLRHGLAMSALAAAQGVGSSVLGRVTATPVEEPGLPSGWVRAEIPADSPTSEVTGRTDGGVYAVGAIVLVELDSTGRVVLIHAPLDLPEGADLVAMGAPGQWLLDHEARIDEAVAEAAKAVEDAKNAVAEAEQAQKRADEIADQAEEDRARVEDAIEKAGTLEGAVAGLEGRLAAAEDGVKAADASARDAAGSAEAAVAAAEEAKRAAEAGGPEAREAAERAAAEAESARNLAASAQAAADAAKADAATARRQAESASSAAGKAQADATAARSVASSAQAEADSAAAKAAAAQAAADAARVKAEAAGKAGDDAKKAAAAAQAKADAAASDALSAKNRADSAAASALGAQRTADAASAKATTASGLVTVSTRSPYTSDGSGKPTNAIWEVQSGGTTLRRYVWTGSVWQQVKAGQDFIGENAVGRAQIAALAVGTGEIADLAVTNEKVGYLTADKIRGTNAELDNAFVNNIVGNRAFLDRLYSSRIVVSGDSIFPDPGFMDAAKWTTANTSIVSNTNFEGGKALRINGTGSQTGVYYRSGERAIRVSPGSYHVTLDVYRYYGSASSGVAVYLAGVKKDGQVWHANTGNMSPSRLYSYQTLEGDITVPDGITGTADLGIYTMIPHMSSGQYALVGSVRVVRKTSAVLLEDGAVTAEKINARSVASEIAQHIRLSTDQLYAGTAKIKSELIAPTISGKTINGSHFNGGDMTFNPGQEQTKISATTLTAYSGGKVLGSVRWRDLVAPPWCNLGWEGPSGVDMPPARDGVMRADYSTVRHVGNGAYIKGQYVAFPVAGWYQVSVSTAWLWGTAGTWGDPYSVASGVWQEDGDAIDWYYAPAMTEYVCAGVVTHPSASGLVHISAGKGIALGWWWSGPGGGKWRPNVRRHWLSAQLVQAD